MDSVRITRALGVKVGEEYDPAAISEGIRRLWATGLFDNVDAKGYEVEGGIEVVVHVAERPKVVQVTFEGLKHFKEEDLKPHVGVRPGDSYRPRLLTAAQDSVLAKYRADGYREAKVTASADSTGSGMWIVLKVEEGKKSHVTAVRFEGNSSFPFDYLKSRLASKTKGFPFRSGTVKEENLEKDLQKIRDFYRERGFRDVDVERLPFEPDPKGGGITLAYRIQEGRYYQMGEVRWQGNTAVSNLALRSLPQPFPGGPYNGPQIRQAVEGAYSLYAEEGYLYLGIEPTETVRDSNIVDLAFQISEGPPSHVRRVRITGNTYTKENVIRRELAIREGGLFRRSALVNSQQNAFRLGFFEDVGVDFQPAESSDVDIVLKIKEKQTGTASAGAGYSSDGGLSGFVNLGHNNLFGNGQSVNIQLERGGRRRAVDLSFNDPSFHNTPMSLGGSAYYTERDVGNTVGTSYFEKRRGFSVQVGRTLPKIRYTRGMVRYRLEGVAIDVRDPLATPELKAQATQGEQITSAFELSLTRNSTNHPFYPNRGQKGTVSAELAGGLWGGDYDFAKFRIDSRWFAKSWTRGWASMLRVRAGALNSYRQGQAVPIYERFRLGGVTYDGLRGYEDYSIVPEENISFPRYANNSSVVLGNFGRFPSPYPGGRFFTIFTLEQQFLIVNPVHGILFAEAGDTWNRIPDFQPSGFKKSVGGGIRVDLPILGNVGFDYAYGFDKGNPGWRGHFLFGAMIF